MATVDHTFTVDAPPAVVFAFLTDPEKATVWQASLLEARFSPDALVHKGTEIHEVRKFLGRRFESTLEVTEYDPPVGSSWETPKSPMIFFCDDDCACEIVGDWKFW